MDLPLTMRAALLNAARSLSVETVPVPVMEPFDVLVKIAAVGLCGSDVHFYENGQIGDLVVDAPLILGHEASGTIVAVGSAVHPDRIGERVAIEPQRPCRRCRYCLTGSYNLCESMQFFSAPPVDGAFAEYLAVPADFAYAIGDGISDNAAALIEPLCVAIAAVRKADVVPGSSLLVSGAGPIGILTAQAARAFGATRIVVADPLPTRRSAALRWGRPPSSIPAPSRSISDRWMPTSMRPGSPQRCRRVFARFGRAAPQSWSEWARQPFPSMSS